MTALLSPARPSGAARAATIQPEQSTPVPPTAPGQPRLWVPKRVLVTASAAERLHTAEVLRRVQAHGVDDIEVLKGDRLTGLRGEDERATYARAKSTLAVVVSPPSDRKLQPIPPSADWQFHIARGCPAHCQYCYLAGSLQGPPVTRVYADLDEILAGLPAYEGKGAVTSRSAARAGEGTTFEASCYTDPLGLEHLTGSLAAAVRHFGTRPDAGLRVTTKYDAVDPLLDLPHAGRTRLRFSVNAAAVSERFEGGTAKVPARLAALQRAALAGYPVGLTVAPIMPGEGWREEYAALFDAAREAVEDVPGLDLTAELITHRFTPGSKEVLTGWYPRTKLEMDESRRAEKRGKYGAKKYVYRAPEMSELREGVEAELAARLPQARVLYWT